ncbi:MAG: zf-TFIIB domain-containing protein [Actinobacteria bacterium]|nr:zf-TFIIB domain-containing protein [Actinomycetota bacterium]
MECPVCARVLTRMTVGRITVDACEGGCGGIWFDRYELMRVDETDESTGEALLGIARDPNLKVDLSKRLNCPKCPEFVMMRHFFSVKRQVVVDECPNCSGHWLDPGELRTIRTEYDSEEERERAAQAYFSEVFGPELAAAHAESEEDLARAQRITHAFRFITPSYYIPGKQEWGAF